MSIRQPKYRRHSSSDNALVCINGQRHYLGRFGSPESKERYRRLVAQYWAGQPIESPRRSKASPCDPDGVTIAEVCAAYAKHAAAYYRKDGAPTKTIYAIKISLEVLDDLFGETNAADFDTAAFDTLIANMVTKGWSRPYVNKHVSQIKRLFKWAVRGKLVPVKVWHEVQLVGGLQLGRTTASEPAPVEPVAESVVEATLPHLPTVVQDMIRLQRATGARPGEICLLRPCDLDRSGKVWTFRPHRHKLQHKGLDRTVYIGPTGQAVLLKYLLREPTAYCFSPREAMVQVQAARRDRRRTRVQPSQQCRRKARPKRQPGPRYTCSAPITSSRSGWRRTSMLRLIAICCQGSGPRNYSPGGIRCCRFSRARRSSRRQASAPAHGPRSAPPSSRRCCLSTSARPPKGIRGWCPCG